MTQHVELLSLFQAVYNIRNMHIIIIYVEKKHIELQNNDGDLSLLAFWGQGMEGILNPKPDVTFNSL